MLKVLFAIYCLLLSFGILANEIDLGTIGASGDQIRFGHKYERSSDLFNQYLNQIGYRRDEKIVGSIFKEDSTIVEQLKEADHNILRRINEE